MTTSFPSRASRLKWGDAEENDDYDGLPDPEVFEEEQPDGSLLRTLIDYKRNDKGQRVKVVKKVRLVRTQVRVNKRVDERKRWAKFGECADAPPGPEKGITALTDEILIEPTRRLGAEEEVVRPKKETTNLGIVCRNCKGDHWTLKCPYKDKLFASSSLLEEAQAQAQQSVERVAERGEVKYVPPGARLGASGRGSEPMSRRVADDAATVRVTNLPEEMRESDLNDLFRKFGHINRVFLAKDKFTGLSKGFAFITFLRRDDAARAIEKLSGKFGYDHLILHLEWARPSGNDAKRI